MSGSILILVNEEMRLFAPPSTALARLLAGSSHIPWGFG